jgi:hypothetical protein
LVAAEDAIAEVQLWTRGYDAVFDMQHGHDFHVTRWAIAGTLRSVDHAAGYEVVDVDGKVLRNYVEVSEPLLGFRRVVRRQRLQPVRADWSSALYEVDGMAIELGPYGLPVRVTADGIMRTFQYDRLAALSERPPDPPPTSHSERYAAIDLHDLNRRLAVSLPRTLLGHKLRQLFERTSRRSPPTTYAIWHSSTGSEIQLVTSSAIAGQPAGGAVTRTRGVVSFHRQTGYELVEVYAPDDATLSDAVRALRPDLVGHLNRLL